MYGWRCAHYIGLVGLALWTAGCENDNPTRHEWSPSFAVIDEPAAVEPGDCSGVSIGEWTYTRDGAGRIVTATRNSASHGTPKAARVEQYTYDDDGRLLRFETDEGDGRLVVALTRGADGAVLRRTVEGDSPETSSEMEVVEADDTHEIRLFRGPVFLPSFDPVHAPAIGDEVRADLTDPGIHSDVIIEELVRRVAGDEDLGEFESFVVRETCVLDAEGRPVAYDWDVSDDGDVDMREIVEYTFADDGHLETASLDRDADGVSDQIVARRYDAADRRVETRLDADADGVFEHRDALTFDDEDRLTEEITSIDGVLTRRVTYASEDGREIVDRDEGADGSIDHVTTIYRRDDGQRVLKREDYDADGDTDWQKRYVYRTDGRRLFEARDRDVDGRVDQRVDYFYDVDGRLIRQAMTEPGAPECVGRGA